MAAVAVAGVTLVAILATGAPYHYTLVEDAGETLTLTPEQPAVRYRVTVCGPQPYTGGSFPFGGDPLFAEPDRTELHIFLTSADREVTFTLERGGKTTTQRAPPPQEQRKVFDHDLGFIEGEDGRYCNNDSILTIALLEASPSATVTWHAEVDYLADIDAPLVIAPSMVVERLPQ
jgi:hypothetical protein